MPTEVVMPQMGESLAEGTITKWHKKPGDRVERDEPLFEITTDKVDTEVPSPISGTLQEILVNEGTTVAVGTVVAMVGAEGAAGAVSSPAPAEKEPASSTAPERAPASSSGHFKSSHEPTTFRRRSSPPTTAASPPDASSPEVDRHDQISPAVASLAAEHRIGIEELLSIPGSGRGGRVTKKDVESYLKRRRAPSPAARPTPPPESSPAPSVAAPSGGSPPARYLYRPEPDDRLVPMSEMRKQIAESVLWSQQISAQLTSFAECDMQRIVRYHEEEGARFEEREGIPLTFLPFIATATVKALKEFPMLNASVVGDQIALKKHVHLGIAVAMDEGLIVPVVRNADEMNFVGLARAIHRLEEKALRGSLIPPDVQGATFTVTNPGLFGGLMGTPMIAQPQVGVLGLGAVHKKPVVIDDAIAIRSIMILALTFDHRIIDGATGFQFLERIRTNLEQFDLPAA